jgi:hypothetical protein
VRCVFFEEAFDGNLHGMSSPCSPCRSVKSLNAIAGYSKTVPRVVRMSKLRNSTLVCRQALSRARALAVALALVLALALPKLSLLIPYFFRCGYLKGTSKGRYRSYRCKYCCSATESAVVKRVHSWRRSTLPATVVTKKFHSSCYYLLRF